jgi:hypothetical protein
MSKKAEKNADVNASVGPEDVNPAATPLATNKPGRKPGSTARPPFPWTIEREEALITLIYGCSDGNACPLSAQEIHTALGSTDLFKSSPVTLTVTNVHDRVARITERMEKAGEGFPTLKRSPRARVQGLTPEDIKRLRGEIANAALVAAAAAADTE